MLSTEELAILVTQNGLSKFEIGGSPALDIFVLAHENEYLQSSFFNTHGTLNALSATNMPSNLISKDLFFLPNKKHLSYKTVHK